MYVCGWGGGGVGKECERDFLISLSFRVTGRIDKRLGTEKKEAEKNREKRIGISFGQGKCWLNVSSSRDCSSFSGVRSVTEPQIERTLAWNGMVHKQLRQESSFLWLLFQKWLGNEEI